MTTVVTTNPNVRVDSGTVTVVKKGTGEVVSQTSYSGGRQVSHSRGGGSTGGIGGATPSVSKPSETLPQVVWNIKTQSWVDLSTHKIMASGEVVSRGTPEGLIRKGIASPFSQERFETPQELERAIAIRESPAFQELYNRALAQGTLASEGYKQFGGETVEAQYMKKQMGESLSQLDPIFISAPSKDISKMTEAERRQYAGVIAPIITSQIEPMATERQRVIEGIDWNTIWFKKGYYDPKSLQALGDFAVVGKEGAVRFEGLGLTPTTTQKVTKEYFTGLGAETEKQLGAFAETRRAFFEPEKVIPQLFGSKEKRLESLGQFQYGIETEREPLQIGMKAFGSAGFQLPLAYATGRAFGWGFGRAEIMAKEGNILASALTSSVAKKLMVGGFVIGTGEEAYRTWTQKDLTVGEKIGKIAYMGGLLYTGFKGFEAGYKPVMSSFYKPVSITEVTPKRPQIAITKEGGVGIKTYEIGLKGTEKVKVTATVPIEETFKMKPLKKLGTRKAYPLDVEPTFITEATKNVPYKLDFGKTWEKYFGTKKSYSTGSYNYWEGIKIEPTTPKIEKAKTLFHERIHQVDREAFWGKPTDDFILPRREVKPTQRQMIKEGYRLELGKGMPITKYPFSKYETMVFRNLKRLGYKKGMYRSEIFARFGEQYQEEVLFPTTKTGRSLSKEMGIEALKTAREREAWAVSREQARSQLEIDQITGAFPKRYIRTSTAIVEPTIREARLIEPSKEFGIKYLEPTKAYATTRTYKAPSQMVETFGRFATSKGIKLPPMTMSMTITTPEGAEITTYKKLYARKSYGFGEITTFVKGKEISRTYYPKLKTYGFKEGIGYTEAKDITTFWKTPEKRTQMIRTPYETTWYRPMRVLPRPITKLPYEKPSIKPNYLGGLKELMRTRKAQLSLTGQMMKERPTVERKLAIERQDITSKTRIGTKQRGITGQKIRTQPNLMTIPKEALYSLDYAPKTTFRIGLAPSLSTRTTPRTQLGVKTTTRVSERFGLSLKGLTTPRLETIPKSDIGLITKLTPKITITTKQTTRITTKPPSITGIPTPTITLPPMTLGGFVGMGAGVSGRMKGFAPRYKRKAGYTPTLYAVFSGVRARLPKGVGSKTFTGMEVRPLPSGRSSMKSQLFTTKKISKKRKR